MNTFTMRLATAMLGVGSLLAANFATGTERLRGFEPVEIAGLEVGFSRL